MTVQESEELTFGFLLDEAAQLLRIQEPQLCSELTYLYPCVRNKSGNLIDANKSLFQVCETMHNPSFQIITEGPLNSLVSDSMLVDVVSWLGLSIQSLGCLFMLVSRRWKRVFGSASAWNQVELNFPFMGTSAGGGSSYTHLLDHEAGLPRIAKLKVVHISLVSPRLRIWLGQLRHDNIHYSGSSSSGGRGFMAWISSALSTSPIAKPKRNVVVVLGESTQRSEALHEAVASILPESSMRAIADAGIDTFDEYVNIQFANHNYKHTDRRLKVLGDERLFFVTGPVSVCTAISYLGCISTIGTYSLCAVVFFFSLSLSLSLYIYIYIYIHLSLFLTH